MKVFPIRSSVFGSLASIASLLLATLAASAHAQSFPNRPIRVVCPYPPGGFLDALGRVTAQRLSENLGQQVLVDNRPGASGVIGGSMVAKAPADGYTLLISVPSLFTIVPHLFEKMPFRTEDLAPVTLLSSSPLLLVTHPSLPAKSAGELIRLARSKPGALAVASAGTGTLLHLAAELFQAETGTRMTHVPYKGSGPALVDLTGGHVQLMFDNIPSALPHAKAGRLRAIAITSRERFSLAPDIPTLRETTLPNYEVANWIGVLAPTATPREIVSLLNRELIRVLRTPEISAKFLENGATPVGSTPEHLASTIKSERAQWGVLARKLAIKSE